mgnify:CR=1 FL=1
MKNKILFGVGMLVSCLMSANAADFNVDVGAAFRHDLKGHTDKGAVLVGSAAFNKYVSGYVQAVSYEGNDKWGGSVIDEGSLGVASSLWSSKRISLGVFGGVTRTFGKAEDWGMGLGLAPEVKLYKNFSLFAASEFRVFIKQRDDILTTAGVSWKF